MEHSLINNELRVIIPRDFGIMDEREMEKRFPRSRNHWGIQNTVQDMIVYVSWTDENLLLRLFSDTPRVMDSAVSRARKQMSSYCREKVMKFQICGENAEGVSFVYSPRKSSERLRGEIAAVKLRQRYYVFAYSARNDDRFYCRQVFHGMLTSMSAL